MAVNFTLLGSPFIPPLLGVVVKFVFASTPKTKGLPDNLKDYAYLNYVESELKS